MLTAWSMKLKLQMFKNNNKKMFDFSNYSAESKCNNDWSTLVAVEIKDKMVEVAIEEIARLKPKM